MIKNSNKKTSSKILKYQCILSLLPPYAIGSMARPIQLAQCPFLWPSTCICFGSLSQVQLQHPFVLVRQQSQNISLLHFCPSVVRLVHGHSTHPNCKWLWRVPMMRQFCNIRQPKNNLKKYQKCQQMAGPFIFFFVWSTPLF